MASIILYLKTHLRPIYFVIETLKIPPINFEGKYDKFFMNSKFIKCIACKQLQC